MAQLKDTIIQGNASITDSLLLGGPLHVYNNSLMLDQGSVYWNIKGGYTPSASRTLTLPDVSGCIATIPTRGTAVGTTNSPVYFSAQGQAAECTVNRQVITTGFNSTNFSAMTLQYERTAGIVLVTFDCTSKIAFAADSWKELYTLPSGYWPKSANIRFVCNATGTSYGAAGQCNAANGKIYIMATGGQIASGAVFRGFFAFSLA